MTVSVLFVAICSNYFIIHKCQLIVHYMAMIPQVPGVLSAGTQHIAESPHSSGSCYGVLY